MNRRNHHDSHQGKCSHGLGQICRHCEDEYAARQEQIGPNPDAAFLRRALPVAAGIIAGLQSDYQHRREHGPKSLEAVIG